MKLIVLAIAILTQYVWHTEVPFWGIFLTFAVAAIYVIPVGTVYAMANLNSNVLTVLGEIISGYLLKGRPLVLLIFKVPDTSPPPFTSTCDPTDSVILFYSSMRIRGLVKL
jgi:hypothetical protein